MFEVGGYGIQQLLRLLSNIVLARLLFPAAFGLTSTVAMLITGLTMLSDVGIQQFIIQSPRGNDQKYLDTAFTFQAIRGAILAVIMVAGAYPAALFFKEPALVPLVIIGASQLLFGGLKSTSIYTFRRRLTLGWVTLLETGQSLLAIAIMVPWAWLTRSVIPLVAGGSIASCAFALVSHGVPVGYRNRLRMDREAFLEIRKFGKWIFGSSMVSFVGAQADRVFLGKILGMTWLGVYSVALNLSDAIFSLVNRLVGGILFPFLSAAGRQPGVDIGKAYYKLRLRMDLFAMTGIGLLGGLGGWVVRALWDSRYQDAAWILRILCIKVALSITVNYGEACLFSLGFTRYGFLKNLSRLVSLFALVPLGWIYGEMTGFLWAMVIAEIPAVVFIWPKLRKLGILKLHRELLSVLFYIAAYFIGVGLMTALPQIHIYGS
jgi:O-antigen/teichoic acid export membrane protein